jgi:hypothetical protein
VRNRRRGPSADPGAETKAGARFLKRVAILPHHATRGLLRWTRNPRRECGGGAAGGVLRLLEDEA